MSDGILFLSVKLVNVGCVRLDSVTHQCISIVVLLLTASFCLLFSLFQ